MKTKVIIDSKKKTNPFIKSSFVYIISTIIGQGMSFLGIMVFSRMMGQREYGQYSTYYAYVSILEVLIGANLFYSLNNAYIEKKDEIKQFRKSGLILSAIIMIVMSAVLFLIGNLVLKKFSPFLIIMAALHSYGFFVVCYRTYSANMEGDYKRKCWLLILPNSLQFLISLLFIIAFPNISFEARIVGSTIGVDFVALVAFIEMIKCDGKIVNREYWRYALSISLPTIVMSLSCMLLQQCDRVMIDSICGAEDTAIYSVIYYLGYAILAIDQATSPVRQAWIFNGLSNGNIDKAKTIQKYYLVVISGLATVFILCGPEIVKILFTSDYWKYEYIVPFVLSACMMVLYKFYSDILLFYKCNMGLSICVLCGAFLNICLNAFAIPVFGAVAACYTTVLSYGLIFALTWVLSRKKISGVYSWKYFLYFLMLVLGVVALYAIGEDYVLVRHIALAILLLVFCIYFIYKKSEWYSILRKDEK